MEKRKKKGLFSFWDSISPFWWKREVTQEDIEDLIDSGQAVGLIDADENEMIHRIFELKDIVVREVMVPRTEIKALDVESPIEDVARLLVEAGHSRLPVYEGTIDRVVGIVYAKDILKYWVSRGKGVSVREIMRKPLFVPETKGIGELFKELKNRRIHIAIVVDEYGGTSGLVTIEDLIEEIVGDIQDEYDIEEEEFVQIGDGQYVVDAKMDTDELSERLGVEVPKNDYDTLGGFLVHLCNKIPEVNQEIGYKNLLFTILEADERKVSKVKITIQPESPEKEVGEEAPQG